MSGKDEQEWSFESFSLDNVEALGLDDLDDEDGVDELLLESDEVVRVARRISGQYVDIIAAFARQAFAGNTDRGLRDEVRSSIDALARLAQASGHTSQSDLLDQFAPICGPLIEAAPRSRERETAVIALRDWIPTFASTLEPDDEQRLNQLVRWEDGKRPPLMDELSNIRGIGPKRLQRLYAAGLFSVDIVAKADPEEVAQVTGLPGALAYEVVHSTRAFALSERRRCLEALIEHSDRLEGLLSAIPIESDEKDLADKAREQVLRVLDRVEKEFK